MTPFNIGDQVVCIDSAAGFEQTVEVEEGQVYTISWIGPFDHYIHGNYIGVRLVGIDRGECPQFGYKNPPFAARRFRPLVKDRLASLRGLLAGGPVVDAPEEPKRKVKEEV